MRIALVYKWDYEADDRYIASDGNLKLRRGKLVAGDDDAAAAASAKRVAESAGAEIVGITLDGGDASWAMARGAACAFRAKSGTSDDDIVVARALNEAIGIAGKFDLIAMGDALEHAGVVPAVAALVGMPCVTGIGSFRADEETEGFIIAERVCGEGIETIRIALPAVVGVRALDSEKSTPSMKQMLAARKAPVDDVDVPEGACPLVADGAHAPESHRATMFEGDPYDASLELVAALRRDGVL